MKRSRNAFLAGLGSGAALLAPGNARAAESYTLRMNLTQNITSTQGVPAVRFAEAIERRSKGQLKIEVYPSGQLSKEAGVAEALSNGVVDIAMQGPAVLAPLVPRSQIFQMPFLFKDSASAFRVLDGPIGTDFLGKLEPKGVVGLGWGTTGFRELETTSKAVTVPEDMRGLRIRIDVDPLRVALVQALGATPVSVDVAEVFTAITQHTIDGLELPLATFSSLKLDTVAKHVAMLNYIFAVVGLLGSKRKIEALPAGLQTILKEESHNVLPFWRAAVERESASAVDSLKKNGVSFTNPDLAAFRRAMAPVYALYQSRFGSDLVDRLTRER